MAAESSHFAPHRLLSQLSHLWQLLVAPNHQIQDSEQRRRARLLSALLLPFIPSLLIMTRWV
jgi:hypothetical protein